MKSITFSGLRHFWERFTFENENLPNNCFNLTIPVVMKIAVVAVLLGNFHAKPFGPELQVKQMLGAPFGAKTINNLIDTNLYYIYRNHFI